MGLAGDLHHAAHTRYHNNAPSVTAAILATIDVRRCAGTLGEVPRTRSQIVYNSAIEKLFPPVGGNRQA